MYFAKTRIGDTSTATRASLMMARSGQHPAVRRVRAGCVWQSIAGPLFLFALPIVVDAQIPGNDTNWMAAAPFPSPPPRYCANICGDYSSAGHCWCDEDCEVFDNCCDDACERCGFGCDDGDFGTGIAVVPTARRAADGDTASFAVGQTVAESTSFSVPARRTPAYACGVASECRRTVLSPPSTAPWRRQPHGRTNGWTGH